MHIESSAFGYGGMIPTRHTCDGKDVVPPLAISDVPEDAASLVIIVDDPDSPSGTWLHWSVWNLPPETRVIGDGNIPEGAPEGRTGFETVGWGGPCPGSGEHRYFFRLFALDTVLELEAGASRESLEGAMHGHIIASSEWMGRYRRA